ncbi:ANTAR domain-containing response regulator [Paenibacillus glycinis]|uniref:ANTAR domain-containing protein n=1 Tax=Paenibacillus glycinis TaxID=2697035 RepID=A0ABW9XW52_9BACL|nr:ANTAR domain-containing protein [Paenibacillus glycinis]NBD26830.1 ANTAR domain-containing protein [Paenibacillus glycinis]
MKAILLLEQGKSSDAARSLRQCCESLHRAERAEEAKRLVGSVDAVVLHAPADAMQEWQSAIAGMRRLPTLWLCPDAAVPKEPDWGFALDGILFGSMNALEMDVALKWGQRAFQQRKRWAEEREQLLQRLEERKWIDQAKAVLCEIKGITEAEAYDFLRKQAMNERKRIGDVSASIVKVYQLIHG